MNDDTKAKNDQDVDKFMSSKIDRKEISKWLDVFTKEELLRGTILNVLDAVEEEINTIAKNKSEQLQAQIAKVFDNVLAYWTKEKSMSEDQLSEAGWMTTVDFIQNEVKNHFNQKVVRQMKLYIAKVDRNIFELVEDESMEVEELDNALNERLHYLLNDGIVRNTLDHIFEILSAGLKDEVFKISIDALKQLENPAKNEIDRTKIRKDLQKLHTPIQLKVIEQKVSMKERKTRLRA